MVKHASKLTIITPKDVYKDSATFSIRALVEVVAQFTELCRRKGLKRNQGLVRLVHYAVFKEWIPEFVAHPQLPGYTPPKHEEPQATPTLED